MLTAAQGNSQLAVSLIDEYKQNPASIEYWHMIFYAWVGDRKNASLIAAEMDGHAFGPGSMSTMIYWCACGMPWDLESTPIFAQKVKESGLPWPPVSPIKFPLKDW